MQYQSVIECSFGFWTANSDGQHITGIHFDDRFNTENIEEDSLSLEAAAQISAYFDKKLQTFDLPLDLENYSEFYQSVWKAVSNIPFGKTLSYSDIASSINNPKSVRAVGLANGKNPYPIVVPCHRVIGKNNSLTGYAYGLDVKKRLLEHEKVLAVQFSLF